MDREVIFKKFKEMFDPLYAPLPDSTSYLRRIGLDPDELSPRQDREVSPKESRFDFSPQIGAESNRKVIEKADKETLDTLIRAHQRSVPFENLDVYDADADISLGVPALYDKIVLRRRGGYCFELNGAFIALLKSLGYDCYSVAVRIMPDMPLLMPLAHRATIVTISGVRYFCDVGFGGPSPQNALLLDERGEQPSGPNVFIIEKDERGTVISCLANGKKAGLFSFMETPYDPVDFIALNENESRSKNSRFRVVRICNIVTETGSIALSDNVLSIHDRGCTVERILKTEPELRAALREHFGLVVNFPLKMV